MNNAYPFGVCHPRELGLCTYHSVMGWCSSSLLQYTIWNFNLPGMFFVLCFHQKGWGREGNIWKNKYKQQLAVARDYQVSKESGPKWKEKTQRNSDNWNKNPKQTYNNTPSTKSIANILLASYSHYITPEHKYGNILQKHDNLVSLVQSLSYINEYEWHKIIIDSFISSNKRRTGKYLKGYHYIIII